MNRRFLWLAPLAALSLAGCGGGDNGGGPPSREQVRNETVQVVTATQAIRGGLFGVNTGTRHRQTTPQQVVINGTTFFVTDTPTQTSDHIVFFSDSALTHQVGFLDVNVTSQTTGTFNFNIPDGTGGSINGNWGISHNTSSNTDTVSGPFTVHTNQGQTFNGTLNATVDSATQNVLSENITINNLDSNNDLAVITPDVSTGGETIQIEQPDGTVLATAEVHADGSGTITYSAALGGGTETF